MAFHVTSPVVIDEGVDNYWVWDFSGTSSPNRSGSTFTCELRNLPKSDGGTVIASLTFDMASAATGRVVGLIAHANATAALEGAFWEVKEVNAAGQLISSAKGTLTLDKQVTA